MAMGASRMMHARETDESREGFPEDLRGPRPPPEFIVPTSLLLSNSPPPLQPEP